MELTLTISGTEDELASVLNMLKTHTTVDPPPSGSDAKLLELAKERGDLINQHEQQIAILELDRYEQSIGRDLRNDNTLLHKSSSVVAGMNTIFWDRDRMEGLWASISPKAKRLMELLRDNSSAIHWVTNTELPELTGWEPKAIGGIWSSIKKRMMAGKPVPEPLTIEFFQPPILRMPADYPEKQMPTVDKEPNSLSRTLYRLQDEWREFLEEKKEETMT